MSRLVLTSGVSDQALTILKYVFLALLYLFFARVLRAVWAEVREPKLVAAAEAVTPGAPATPRAKREPKISGKLVVIEPSSMKGQQYALGDELTVGRAEGCGVPLTSDTFASAVHARVFRRDGEVWVEDLGSTNGTFLNDQQVVAPSQVRRGDRVRVGRTVLELQK